MLKRDFLERGKYIEVNHLNRDHVNLRSSSSYLMMTVARIQPEQPMR